VDAENYRLKREESLERLAVKVAAKGRQATAATSRSSR
jgi:predicted RNA-binding protein Jag